MFLLTSILLNEINWYHYYYYLLENRFLVLEPIRKKENHAKRRKGVRMQRQRLRKLEKVTWVLVKKKKKVQVRVKFSLKFTKKTKFFKGKNFCCLLLYEGIWMMISGSALISNQEKNSLRTIRLRKRDALRESV